MSQKDIIANLDILFNKSKQDNKSKTTNFKVKEQKKTSTSEISKSEFKTLKLKNDSNKANNKKSDLEKKATKLLDPVFNHSSISNLANSTENVIKINPTTQIAKSNFQKMTSSINTSITIQKSIQINTELSTSPPIKRVKYNKPYINEITSDSDKEFINYINTKLTTSLTHRINPEINSNINYDDLISIIMNTKQHNPSKQSITEWDNNKKRTVPLINTPGKHMKALEKKLKNSKENYIRNHISQKVSKRMNLYTITEDEKINMKYDDYLSIYNLWLEYIIPLKKLSSTNMLLQHCELEGGKIRILRSKTPILIGFVGIILQETSNTFIVIGSNNEIKQIIKNNHIFELIIENHNSVIFSGCNLRRIMPGLISSQDNSIKNNKHQHQKRCTHPFLYFSK